MAVTRRLLVPATIVAVGLALTACSRKITRVAVVQQPQSCFECHSDSTTALVAAEQQWEHSLHASGGTLSENFSDCKGCHTSEGFVARATGATAPSVIDNPTSIHCFTCHAPHTNGDFRVRWTAVATLKNGASYDLMGGNLCVACHLARNNVTTYVSGRPALSEYWGPHHGVQGDMLIGSNGYEYAGYTYGKTNHRLWLDNGCLDCHMKTTLQNVVGGHSFNMEYSLGAGEVLNTAACVKCHDEIGDFSDVGVAEEGFSVQDSVDVLIGRLEGILVANNLISSTGDKLPESVTTSADSAGAVWNLLMAREDRSHGVHNARYIMGLLESSIAYMQGGRPQLMVAAREQQAAQQRRRTR